MNDDDDGLSPAEQREKKREERHTGTLQTKKKNGEEEDDQTRTLDAEGRKHLPFLFFKISLSLFAYLPFEQDKSILKT